MSLFLDKKRNTGALLPVFKQIMLKMKLTVVLLVAMLWVNAGSLAQKVTLSVKNESIIRVFSTIRKQTGYNFVYGDIVASKSQPVTLAVKNVPLQDALALCMKGQPLTYSIVAKTVVVKYVQPAIVENTTSPTSANADQMNMVLPQSAATLSPTFDTIINVKGRVIDVDGNPVEGAVVAINKGKSDVTNGMQIGRQVITDKNGRFEMNGVPRFSDFLIRKEGFNIESFELNNNRTPIFSLQKTTANKKVLDEVVIVGYGEKKREQVTSAITTLSTKQITDMPTTSISQVFAGRTPGMLNYSSSGAPGEEAGSGFIMTVRTANKDGGLAPLKVIDGVPSTQISLQNLSPDEIESISVLKDNSATAVYGARAANGVIVITTKRGKIGKPQFSYTGNYTWSSPTRFATRLNSYEYALQKNEYNVNSGLAPLYSAGILDTIKNQLSPYQYANTNWLDPLVHRKGFVQNQSFSVSGGNEGIKYFIIGTFADQGGMIPSDYYRRYTLQSNLDINLSKQFKTQINIGYRNNYLHYPGGGSSNTIMGSAANNSPLVPAYMPNGSYGAVVGSSNPFAVMSDNSGYQYTNSNLLTLQGRLTWQPTFFKGFSAYINYYTDKSFTRGKNYIVPVPTYSVDNTSPTGYKQIGGVGLPSLTDANSDATTYTADFALAYNRQFDKHGIDVLALYTQSQSTSNNNSDTRINLIAPGLDVLNIGPTTGETTSGSRGQSGRLGFVGRVGYNYDKRLYAEISFREDGSANFAPGHRWGFFPAGSLGWTVSNENWFKGAQNVVNFLKLRGSVGLTGDDNIGAYTYYYLYGIANTGTLNGQGYIFGTTYTPTFYLSNNTLPSINITWAKNIQTNFGFDATMWEGKLGVSFDIYQKNRYDILQSKAANLPTTFGIGAPVVNYGKTRDKGFEIALTSDHKLGRDWSLSFNANLTYVKSTYVENGTKDLPDYQRTEGHTISSVSLYHALGIFQTQDEITSWKVDQDGQKNATLKPGDLKYADLDGDGKITAADKRWVENYGFPPINYGFGFDLKYKQLILTVFFNGAVNNNTIYNYSSSTTWWKYIYDNSWRGNESTALFPRISSSNNNNSSYYFSDWQMFTANYLRLRNVRLNYDLPTRWLNVVRLKQIRIYMQASNLLTFSKVQAGIDPEFPSTGSLGSSPSFYPNQKNIGFGVNVNF